MEKWVSLVSCIRDSTLGLSLIRRADFDSLLWVDRLKTFRVTFPHDPRCARGVASAQIVVVQLIDGQQTLLCSIFRAIQHQANVLTLIKH